MNAQDISTYRASGQSTRIVPLRPVRIEDSGVAPDNLIVSCAEGIHVIPFNEIRYCTAESNYVRIFFGQDQSVVASKTLLAVERCMLQGRFVKVHQSHIVAIDQIRLVAAHEVVLASGDKLPVSQSRRDVLKKAIVQIGVRLV